MDNSFQEFPPYVPIVEGQWPEELWKAVREHKGVGEGVSAPLTEIGNDISQPDMDLTSLYGDMGW